MSDKSDSLLVDCAGPIPQGFNGRLPAHDFHIGEGGVVHLGQLPNFRYMVFHAIGKAPMPLPDGQVDTLGTGPFALGRLIGDAYLKVTRPGPLPPDALLDTTLAGGNIDDIADVLLPLSPRAKYTRAAFLARVEEFIEIALNYPEHLPPIIANLDALTNERLTERAREILTTGIDPGDNDLWRAVGTIPRESNHVG